MKTKLLLLLLVATQAVVAQVPAAQVCDKAEYRIRMRDGVALHTTVYTPKGAADAPMLVQRTPYGCAPYGEGKFPKAMEKGYLRSYIDAGYIVVLQDVRGRYMSEGDYENVRPAATSPDGTDERTDAYDTVEWLVGNVAHTNGRVGFFGSSYPGFYAIQGALCGHETVVAASPQAPVTDWFMGDDAHHNGVLMLCDDFTFLPGMSHTDHSPAQTMPAKRSFDTAPDIYDFFLRAGTLDSLRRMVAPASFWNDMAAHPDDAGKHAGEQMLVRGDIMRGRYRRSFTSPEPFVPGRAEDVEFSMADIAHTFAAGHRIMVQVQSSWFPVAERSPQQFVDLWHCTAADFVECRIGVYGGESWIECGRR